MECYQSIYVDTYYTLFIVQTCKEEKTREGSSRKPNCKLPGIAAAKPLP